MSLFGIFLGLALLVFLAFKGKSLIWGAPLCVLVLAVTSQLNPLEVYANEYMTGFGDFVITWFPTFMLSAIFGKIMEVTGGARAVTEMILNKIGRDKAMLVIFLSGAVLTYGGISCWVVIFAVYPIAVTLFREANIPRRLMPAAIAAGTFSCAMTTLPGTPQIHNLLPGNYFGTTPMAAPLISIVGSVIMIVGNIWWLNYRAKKLKGNGEIWTEQEGGAVVAVPDNLPNPWITLVPFVVILVTLNVFKWNIVVCLLIGVLLSVAFNYKRIPDIGAMFNDGCMDAVKSIVNTASVTGFGSVVKITAGFATLVTLVLSIGGSPLIFESIAVNILAAASGSASGGLTIALDALGSTFLEMANAAGISPEALHRVASMSSGVLNTMPHDGAVVTYLAYCGISHRQGFYDIFWVNAIIPGIALVVAIIMGSVGLV